jgi:hypothetical protein
MNIRNVWRSLLIVAGLAMSVRAGDWVTAPSYFTHDPYSGERVQQYSPIGPFYTYPRADFQRSGFHHTRSSIQVNGASDNYFVVEEWGREVRPYGEWQFPYRPYSVPYPLWGPPYGFAPYGAAPYGFVPPYAPYGPGFVPDGGFHGPSGPGPGHGPGHGRRGSGPGHSRPNHGRRPQHPGHPHGHPNSPPHP